jgi:hypothetical protein
LVSDRIDTRRVAMIAMRPFIQVCKRLSNGLFSVRSKASVGSPGKQVFGFCNHSRAQPIDGRCPMLRP